jgi:hypothetical protein
MGGQLVIPLDAVTLDTSFSATESMYEYVNVMAWFITHINSYLGHPKKSTCRWLERGRIMGIP